MTPSPVDPFQAVSYLISCVVVLATLGGPWLHAHRVLSFAAPWDTEKVSLTLFFTEISVMKLLVFKE